MKKMAKKRGVHLNTKTQKTKTELLRKLNNLGKKYPEDNIRSLDNWDQKGFPSRIKVDICGLPVTEGRRNTVLQQKYGFHIDSDDDNLYYGGDLRSYSGQLVEDDGNCVKLNVHTTRTGISPVGSDAKKVRRLIKDAADIEFRE